jgi:hypothetical protein
MMVYDTTLNNLFIWTGAAWESVPASGDSSNTQVIFNDNGNLSGDSGLTYNKTTKDLSAAGNIVVSTSGKGIDFTATPGIGTSELLNDYEEGVWTPVVADAATGGNQGTTATAVGLYTKVGRLVTVHFEVTGIDTTGLNAGNALNIRGLPFTASSATTQFGTITGVRITFSGFLTCGAYNGTAFQIYQTSSGGALADIKVSGFTSGTAAVYGTLTYLA